MRALRIATLGLLPLAAGACWVERPNLQSTGGGYTSDATVSRPADSGEGETAGTPADPAGAHPAPLSP